MKFILLTRIDGVQVLVNLSDVFEIVDCEDHRVVLLSSISNSKHSWGLYVSETIKQITDLING